MRRYLRLYLYFVRFSLSRAMEFRVDFFFRIVMDSFYYIVNLAFFHILFLHTSLLAGWSEDQVMIFVGTYITVDALNMTIFSNNLWWFPIFVNRGDMDYYLVRPISTLFFMSVRDFAANSMVNLLIAIGILIWAIARYPQPLSTGRICLFALLVINGCFLHYMLHMIFLLPVFWLHSTRGFDQVFYNLASSFERPDRIYSGWVRLALITILPFCLMASFPARVLLEAFNSHLLVNLVVISAIFFIILLVLWHLALRSYSSASS